MLDDERNDIYLHIDKKVVLGSLEQDLFRLAKARLFVLEQRLDVRWGDISVVKAELLLLETASMKGPYDYYHLLSGVDLPIKSQDLSIISSRKIRGMSLFLTLVVRLI